MAGIPLSKNRQGGAVFPESQVGAYGRKYKDIPSVGGDGVPRPSKSDWEWYYGGKCGARVPIKQLGAAQRYFVDEQAMQDYLAGKLLTYQGGSYKYDAHMETLR